MSLATTHFRWNLYSLYTTQKRRSSLSLAMGHCFHHNWASIHHSQLWHHRRPTQILLSSQSNRGNPIFSITKWQIFTMNFIWRWVIHQIHVSDIVMSIILWIKSDILTLERPGDWKTKKYIYFHFVWKHFIDPEKHLIDQNSRGK